jgi:hypothetical protein
MYYVPNGEGNFCTYLNGELHSYNELPALISPKGDRYWYNHGYIERFQKYKPNIDYHGSYKDDYVDLPSAILANGDMYWYEHGKIHRDRDLPAVIETNGDMYWCIDGYMTRDDKPAVILNDGRAQWWCAGEKIKECDNYRSSCKSFSNKFEFTQQ